jgi:hypothetical protein
MGGKVGPLGYLETEGTKATSNEKIAPESERSKLRTWQPNRARAQWNGTRNRSRLSNRAQAPPEG